MPTNEERKALAKRLRVLASHAPADADMVLDALDLYPGEYIEGFDPRCVERLADLIEPEPERTCEIEFDFPQGVGFKQIECRCSECWHGMSVHDHYCAECGAKVVE